jgi:site-specific DNA-cytosine methylase
MSKQLRVLELFAGIGGFSAAYSPREVVAAIDIDQAAKQTYERNFERPYYTRSIESITFDWIASLEADMWWMSPPCQPYTRRGSRRDLEDPRSRGLIHLMSLLKYVRPEWILLENVLGFRDSETWKSCQSALKECDYRWMTLEVCPSSWGWPNRRPRFYVMATLGELPSWRPTPTYSGTWRDFVDAQYDEKCLVEAGFVQRYHESLDRLTASRVKEPAACFGSSYGVASSGSGSYLEIDAGKYRRFSPEEVLRLLGFSDSFQFAEGLTLRKKWSLAGNSLSIPVIRYLISHLPN